MADPKRVKTKDRARPDFATLGGLLLAFGGIAGGLVVEGGKLRDIAQITSALIVLGGTIGAVMITTPLPVLIRAAKRLGSVFFSRDESVPERIEEIIEYATQARRNGILSLEPQTSSIEDPFLRKALELAVDGVEPARSAPSWNSISSFSNRMRKRKRGSLNPRGAMRRRSASSGRCWV